MMTILRLPADSDSIQLVRAVGRTKTFVQRNIWPVASDGRYDSSGSCIHEMLGSAAVAFREAIAHAPSAASLGMYTRLCACG
jgi:hypothetical protein